jgi:hypothetical protein
MAVVTGHHVGIVGSRGQSRNGSKRGQTRKYDSLDMHSEKSNPKKVEIDVKRISMQSPYKSVVETSSESQKRKDKARHTRGEEPEFILSRSASYIPNPVFCRLPSGSIFSSRVGLRHVRLQLFIHLCAF